MRSDEIFYRLFQEAPSSYFELIGAPAETAADYKFSAEELKHAGLRLDGVFLPKRAGVPVHFVEAFTYKTPHAYSNLLAKVFLWLETHDPLQDWRACVIFASRGLEPSDDTPYRELFGSGRVKRVFLDQLGEPAADQFGLGILDLIACPADQTLNKAKTWVERMRGARSSLVNRRALVELIEVVVLSRLPKLGRKELERMLQLTDVRKSRVFAEGLEEGREKTLEQVATRLLAQGDPAAKVAEATGLSVAQVKRLMKKKSPKA